MPTIKRAIIKSYDAAANRATIQVAGSLAVWLETLPVSVAIAPEDVVAGRECGVLFFTDDNSTDATVVSIHNVAAPQGRSRIRDADLDTRVETEASPDEDKVRITIAGTLRGLFQTTTPHITLTGDVQMVGHGGIGPAAAPSPSYVLNVTEDGNSASSLDGINNIVRQASTGPLRGVTGECQVQAASSGSISHVRGLEFRANHAGASTVTDLFGAAVSVEGLGPATNRRAAYFNTVVLIAGATTSDVVVAHTASTGNRTVPAHSGFRSTLSMSATDITVFKHFAADNATLISSAVVDELYGHWCADLTAGTRRHPFWDSGVNNSTSDNNGNHFKSNTAFFTTGVSGLFGGGNGVMHIQNAATVPTTNPTAGVIVYSTGADLVVRGTGGHLVTIPATTVPNVTGSRGGNAALLSLLTALANLGYITDSTT